LSTVTLPRLFHVTYESGVQEIYYFMENPREWSIDNKTYLLYVGNTQIMMTFGEEEHVLIHGQLRVAFDSKLKIMSWEFENNDHKEYHTKQTNGGKKLVNEFGLTSEIMRCFEFAEVITTMEDLIYRSYFWGSSPLESLQQFNKDNINNYTNQHGAGSPIPSLPQYPASYPNNYPPNTAVMQPLSRNSGVHQHFSNSLSNPINNNAVNMPVNKNNASNTNNNNGTNTFVNPLENTEPDKTL